MCKTGFFLTSLEDQMSLTTKESAVWKEWGLIDDDHLSPVKEIAKRLSMIPADVAFIVYPAETFGAWADDQEPDLL